AGGQCPSETGGTAQSLARRPQVWGRRAVSFPPRGARDLSAAPAFTGRAGTEHGPDRDADDREAAEL
ncbi:MAG: hypothetical protein AVDCRST_MAG19-1292, partial [uncultured Thermomicrobiales bacterium]